MSTRLDSDANSRLIPMQCGDDESYVLHFYDVTDDDGNTTVQLDIYEADKPSAVYQSLSSPFPAGSEREIRYVQSFDVIFFAQGETYPCKLSREENNGSDESITNDYVFTFEDVDFTVEPLMDWEIYSENTLALFAQSAYDAIVGDDGTIKSVELPVGTVISGDSVTISASNATLSSTTSTNEDDSGEADLYLQFLLYLSFSASNASTTVSLGDTITITYGVNFSYSTTGTDWTISDASVIYDAAGDALTD